MNYNTKQSEAVLDFLKLQKDKHITATDIISQLGIGKATVYRQLEKLVKTGEVKRYIIDENSSACFQYVEENDKNAHFHLKCEGCGELVHVNGGVMPDVAKNLEGAYGFEIDVNRTVFYGKCKLCNEQCVMRNEQ